MNNHRTEYDKFMAEYRRLHAACPKCGSTSHSTTLVGYILNLDKKEEYKDRNRCTCMQCGDIHICHDRVPTKEPRTIWQINDEEGNQLAYQREGEDPVFVDAVRAVMAAVGQINELSGQLEAADVLHRNQQWGIHILQRDLANKPKAVIDWLGNKDLLSDKADIIFEEYQTAHQNK